jgi:hypothetical protein
MREKQKFGGHYFDIIEHNIKKWLALNKEWYY